MDRKEIEIFVHAAAAKPQVIAATPDEILRDVLKTKIDPERFPAQAIQPTQGELKWLVDQQAASLLG